MCFRFSVLAIHVAVISIWITHCSVLAKKVPSRKWSVDYLQQAEYIPSFCRNFTEGDKLRQFFETPGYPKNYSAKLDCVHTIEAPVGHIVQLDFRGLFNIERSVDCQFDYLDIHDGFTGYSPSLGRYCGDAPPSMPITSTGRYMWVHFHSDDTIELNGIHAVYKKLINRNANKLKPVDECWIIMQAKHDGLVNTSQIDFPQIEYANRGGTPLDCTWDIRALPGYVISLKINELKMGRSSQCNENSLEAYDGVTGSMMLIRRDCATSANQVITTTTNRLVLRWYLNPYYTTRDFRGTYTVLRTGECRKDEEFNCGDGTCIHNSLKCNDRQNCPLSKDELDCSPPVIGSPNTHTEDSGIGGFLEAVFGGKGSRHVLIIGIASGGLLLVIISAVCILCIQRRKASKSLKKMERQRFANTNSPPEEAAALINPGLADAEANGTSLSTADTTLPSAKSDPTGKSMPLMENNINELQRGGKKRQRPLSVPGGRQLLMDRPALSEKPAPLPRSSSLKSSEKLLSGIAATSNNPMDFSSDDEYRPAPPRRTSSLERLRVVEQAGAEPLLTPHPKPKVPEKPSLTEAAKVCAKHKPEAKQTDIQNSVAHEQSKLQPGGNPGKIAGSPKPVPAAKPERLKQLGGVKVLPTDENFANLIQRKTSPRMQVKTVPKSNNDSKLQSVNSTTRQPETLSSNKLSPKMRHGPSPTMHHNDAKQPTKTANGAQQKNPKCVVNSTKNKDPFDLIIADPLPATNPKSYNNANHKASNGNQLPAGVSNMGTDGYYKYGGTDPLSSTYVSYPRVDDSSSSAQSSLQRPKVITAQATVHRNNRDSDILSRSDIYRAKLPTPPPSPPPPLRVSLSSNGSTESEIALPPPPPPIDYVGGSQEENSQDVVSNSVKTAQ